MEEVIRRIIEIEQEAQGIMDETLKENEKKIKDAEESVSKLEEKILGDAKKKISSIRERELSENEETAVDIRHECDRHLIDMEKKAKANEDQWVDYLVEKVLGD